MSDHAETIQALQDKRAELASQVQQLQATIYHLDAALAAFGHGPAKTYQRRFTNGELIRLIGDAERAGTMTPTSQARWIIKAKGWDEGDRALARRILHSVKECRKRLNARGA